MKLAIILPTYNEKENLERLIFKIFELNLKNFKIIIIDDNSPDGTGLIAQNLSEKYPDKIEVILRPGKLGLGSALRDGFKKALKENCDVVLSIDCDFSHDPKSIPLLLEAIKEADMVIGSRYIPQGRISGWNLKRRILSYLANHLTYFILGVKSKDNTTGFRVYKASFLKKLPYTRVKSEGYSFFIEISFWAQKRGFKIKEVPIHFINRQEGKSKISRREVYKAFLTLIRLFLKRFS